MGMCHLGACKATPLRANWVNCGTSKNRKKLFQVNGLLGGVIQDHGTRMIRASTKCDGRAASGSVRLPSF